MPVRGIIFDFGGTLGAVTRAWDNILQEGAQNLDAFLRGAGMDKLPQNFPERWLDARKFAATKSYREQEEHRADDTLVFLLQFIGYPNADRALVRQGLAAFFQPEVAAWQPYPDALDTVRHLHARGHRLGLLSNATDETIIETLLQRHGFGGLFDPVVVSCTLDYRKPRPEAFHAILDDAWDIPGYEAVMVGDHLQEDIRGAQDVGMWAILANMTPNPMNEPFAPIVTPDATVDQLADIVPIIAAWDRA